MYLTIGTLYSFSWVGATTTWGERTSTSHRHTTHDTLLYENSTGSADDHVTTGQEENTSTLIGADNTVLQLHTPTPTVKHTQDYADELATATLRVYIHANKQLTIYQEWFKIRRYVLFWWSYLSRYSESIRQKFVARVTLQIAVAKESGNTSVRHIPSKYMPISTSATSDYRCRRNSQASWSQPKLKQSQKHVVIVVDTETVKTSSTIKRLPSL